MEKNYTLKTPPKYWVASGAGMNGFAFIGTIRKFEEIWGAQCILKSKGWYASSMGALLLTFYTIGYTTEEIQQIFLSFPFDTLISPTFDNFWNECYLEDGQMFYTFIESCLKERNIEPTITLQQLYNKTGLLNGICVSNITLSTVECWTHLTHPHIPLIDALRITSAYPFFFPPVIYSPELQNPQKTYLYTDGALFCPYPFRYIPKKHIQHTIGLYYSHKKIEDIDTKEYTAEELKPHNLMHFIQMLFRSSRVFLTHTDISITKDIQKQTVFYTSSILHELDFSPSHEEREMILAYGYTLGSSFLESFIEPEEK